MLGMKSQLASRLTGGGEEDESMTTCGFPARVQAGNDGIEMEIYGRTVSGQGVVRLIHSKLRVPVRHDSYMVMSSSWDKCGPSGEIVNLSTRNQERGMGALGRTG